MQSSTSTKEQVRLPESFGIRFGILAPSIDKQIRQQKLKFKGDDVANFERMRNAINDLNFGGLLVDSQTKMLFRKLYNKILRHIGKENNCNVHPIK